MKTKKNIEKIYKFAVIATDMVILTLKEKKLQVLLIKMKKTPFENYWAAPGGLIGVNETVEQAAERILSEKTGIKKAYLEQLYTFSEVDRDPFGRVVSVAHFALLPYDKLNLKTTKEYGGVEWFATDDLPLMAYDHEKVIKMAVERLKAKLEYTNIACSLLPDNFSLGELQNVYEIILKKKLDKRNFRKKILSLNILKKSGKIRGGLPNRPADLYSFSQKNPQIIKMM